MATFDDTEGLTAKVAAAFAAGNVNILAGTAYSASGMRRKATFILILDDFVKAEKALEKIGADDVRDSSVITVEMANKVGALERISTVIANAGINIFDFYSTTSSGNTAACVIKTEDDKKTIKVLSQSLPQLRHPKSSRLWRRGLTAGGPRQLTRVPYGNYLSLAQSAGPEQEKNIYCIGASLFPLSDERMQPSASAGEGSLSCPLG